MILIVIKAEIRADKRDQWLTGIADYTAGVRAEPGNISFDCYESIDAPNHFSIIECFADGDAGSAHVATQHAQDFFGWFPQVIVSVPKIKYQDLEGGWDEMAEVQPS
jgi:quinol monooxygenase YgiN